MQTNATKGILAGLFAVAVLIATMVSQAAGATLNVAGSITGTLSGPNTGPCASGYANQCSGFNATACENFTPTGTVKIVGNFGTGTVTSMCITVDPGNNVNEPTVLTTHDTCSPIYGDLTSMTTHKGKVTNTDVNFAGVFCHHQATSLNHMIEAGFGIEGQAPIPRQLVGEL
jgi:hypothetical protein